MLRRSIARCQPGLYCRWPSTIMLFARSLNASISASACSSSSPVADDADQVVHRLLQVLLDRVGVLAALDLERRQRAGRRRLTSASATFGRSSPRPAAYAAACLAGPLAEHQQVAERVAAEPVGAVHAAGALAHGVQARDRALLGVGVDLDAAHDVVAGRTDLHRLGGDVDVGQLLELVVHRRQPLAG